jgi:hypothetical protein
MEEKFYKPIRGRVRVEYRVGLSTDLSPNYICYNIYSWSLFFLYLPEAEKYEESLISIRFDSDLVRKKILYILHLNVYPLYCTYF